MHGWSDSSSEEESPVQRSKSSAPATGGQSGPNAAGRDRWTNSNRESAANRGRPTPAKSMRVLPTTASGSPKSTRGHGALLRRKSSRLSALGLRSDSQSSRRGSRRSMTSRSHSRRFTSEGKQDASSGSSSSGDDDEVFGHGGSLLGNATSIMGVHSHLAASGVRVQSHRKSRSGRPGAPTGRPRSGSVEISSAKYAASGRESGIHEQHALEHATAHPGDGLQTTTSRHRVWVPSFPPVSSSGPKRRFRPAGLLR